LSEVIMTFDYYDPHLRTRTYTGKIYFQDPYAFLMTAPSHSVILQFDPNLNCKPNSGVQRQTATDLRPGRYDGDPFTVRGIEKPSTHNPLEFILFWDILQ
jgi:hypothetical protein